MARNIQGDELLEGVLSEEEENKDKNYEQQIYQLSTSESKNQGN